MPKEAPVALDHIEYGTPFLKTGTDDARVLPILDRADAHVVPLCQRTLGDSCGVNADIGSRLSGLHAFPGFFQSSFHTLHYKSRLTELKRTHSGERIRLAAGQWQQTAEVSRKSVGVLIHLVLWARTSAHKTMKVQNRDDQDDSPAPKDLGLTFTGDEDPEGEGNSGETVQACGKPGQTREPPSKTGTELMSKGKLSHTAYDRARALTFRLQPIGRRGSQS